MPRRHRAMPKGGGTHCHRRRVFPWRTAFVIPFTSTHTPVLSLPPRMPVYPINEMREVVVDQGGVELSSAPGAQEHVIQSVENNVSISRTPSEGQAFAEFQGNHLGNQLGNHVRRLDGLQGVPFQELIGCEIPYFNPVEPHLGFCLCCIPTGIWPRCRKPAAVCNLPKSLQSSQNQAGIRAIPSMRTVPYA
jgi:hypothetical protein